MKVMIITQLPPPNGGIATWSKSYIQELKHYQDVELVTINCALIGKRALNFNTRNNILLETYRAIKIITKIIINLRKQQPDIVHLNTTCSKLGVIRDWLCCHFIRTTIPIVLHCHCSIESQISNKIISKYFFVRMAKRASQVIVLNQNSRKVIEDEFGLKAQVIANFIENDIISTKEHLINNKVKEVIFVGHLLETKGTKEMLAIASENPDISFYFAGAYNTDMQQEFKLDNIYLLGDLSRNDIINRLDRSDLFLFLSYAEGFSLSLLEAMARGVPCLVSDVGANKEMIEDEAGIVVQVKDIKAALEGFRKIVFYSADKRKEMSKWGINKVKNNYTSEIICAKLLDIYKELIEK